MYTGIPTSCLDQTTECVLILQNVFSCYRMCYVQAFQQVLLITDGEMQHDSIQSMKFQVLRECVCGLLVFLP